MCRLGRYLSRKLDPNYGQGSMNPELNLFHEVQAGKEEQLPDD